MPFGDLLIDRRWAVVAEPWADLELHSLVETAAAMARRAAARGWVRAWSPHRSTRVFPPGCHSWTIRESPRPQ
jgi:hypothetical protein